MPIPNLDYKEKCCALKLLPLDKQLLLNKCVLMRKVVHGKAPQYLKDLMIPSERLHVHGNKQLLPRTRIDIFKTGSLAWNSLAHHLRYPMELKTFKRKAFQAFPKPPCILRYTSCFIVCLFLFLFFLFFSLVRQLDKMCRMLLLFSLPCCCKVLDLYLCVCVCVWGGGFSRFFHAFSIIAFFIVFTAKTTVYTPLLQVGKRLKVRARSNVPFADFTYQVIVTLYKQLTG